jgi:anti-sigma factor RsiW
MMHQDTALKLQAYLDGELPSGEARRAAELVEKDPEARALFEELRGAKILLAGNQPELQVPESREFYWSKIAREIGRQDSVPTVAPAGAQRWWLRLLAPAGAVAALVLGVTLALNPSFGPKSGWATLAEGQEIDTPLEETSSISFRSEAAGMTVVWVDSHGN